MMRPLSSFAGGPAGYLAVALLVAATFAAGFAPHLARPAYRPMAEPWGGAGGVSGVPYREVPHTPPQPVEVVRVIDGDTFDARVLRSAGGGFVRVRLRDIDAAELKARCASEFRKAVAARVALARILAEGSVRISDVGPDKYPERIDAHVATRLTPDVSAALLRMRLVRPYDGGHRRSWCWSMMPKSGNRFSDKHHAQTIDRVG